MAKFQPQKNISYVISSAGKISFISGLGFISALMVDIIIVSRFGISQETDALFIAITLPQFISSICLVVINVVLVPLFAKVWIEQGKNNVWYLTNNLINAGFMLFIPISIIGILGSPITISILGAGLTQSTKSLAIDLSRILFLTVIPVGAIEVVKASLNASNSFAFPAAISLIKNFSVILTILLAPLLEIHTVAIGYVIAAFAQLVFIMTSLFIRGFRYKLSFSIEDRVTQMALHQMRHPLAGALMGQGNVLIERFLASFLPFGVVSTIGYAKQILRAVDNIFVGSVTTAFLPYLSSQSINNDIINYKRTLITSIKILILLSFSVSALIIGLSESIVRLLFERAAFRADDTLTLAFFLSIYLISIPAWAVFQALQTAFYSIGDTKRPFLFRLASFVLNLILNFFLFFIFRAPGLALALTLSRTAITLLSAWILNRRIQIIDTSLISFFARVALASLLLVTVLLILEEQFKFSYSVPLVASILDIFFKSAIGLFVFALSLLALRIKEVVKLFQFIKNLAYGID
ncbi:MAG: murein biosynthesis integral membrane protein MurJ [Anaerolineaceae bacterium]|nr:murein biosynthesis integral membrane protein MurJ [Anaerolineaceae bacterium]